MKVVTLAIVIGLAVVGDTQFRLPTLSSLFTGFRPLLLSFPRFRPRPPQRPALILAGQYIQSPQQTFRHEPEVFSPVEAQPIFGQHQTHQPAKLSSSFISPILTTPPQSPPRVEKDQHHKTSRKIPNREHKVGLHRIQPTKSSFKVVKSTKHINKPTNRHGFEPLRPESILKTEQSFKSSEMEIITNIIEKDTRPSGKSIVKEQFLSNTKVEKGHKNNKPSSFSETFTMIKDTSIIGMLPPPPPPSLQSQEVHSQSPFSNSPQPPMPVSSLPPPPPPFSLPKSNDITQLPRTTNDPLNISLFILSTTFTPNTSLATPSPVTNGLPILNAGVLPLEDESPDNFVAFPPFGNLIQLKDELSLQELFPPFPPNNNLFTES